MGSGNNRKEIINTPEAKGMPALPSSRGESINVSQLAVRREVGLKTLHAVPVGHEVTPAEYLERKAAAKTNPDAARALQLLQADSAPSGGANPNPTLHLSIDFAGLDDTEWAPPDSQLAVGVEQLLVAVNASWAVLDKTGRQLLRRNFSDLFSPLIENAVIYSPRICYDHFRNGWLITACAKSIDGQNSWLLLAATMTDDALSDWWIWALDAGAEGSNRTGHWADGLGVSVDNHSVFLTMNMFSGSGNFVYSKLRVLNKKGINTGGVIHGWDFWHLRNFDGTPAFGLQPAVNFKAGNVQYLVNAAPDGQGLTQWGVTRPTSQAPTLTRKLVPTIPFQIAPNSNQPMSEREIDTGDTRMGNVVFRHGFLWTSHTVAANWGDDLNVAAIQWFQINPRTARVIQQGIYGSPHFHYFSPSLMVDGESNLIMGFNRAGNSELPTIRITGRCAADEPNTLQESLELQQSSASAETPWSMFSTASIAPGDPAIWIMGQYAATQNDWATWIGAGTYAATEDSKNNPVNGLKVYT